MDRAQQLTLVEKLRRNSDDPLNGTPKLKLEDVNACEIPNSEEHCFHPDNDEIRAVISSLRVCGDSSFYFEKLL